jgi:hypothetical protein
MNQTQSLIPSTIIENVIDAFGIFGNLNIILATIQSKALRSNCNLLIAMQALFDLLGEFGGFVEGVTVYTSHPKIDPYLCFFLQLVPAIGINMSTMTLLMIGIDRIIAIKYAFRYELLSIKFIDVRFQIFTISTNLLSNCDEHARYCIKLGVYSTFLYEHIK